MTAWKQGLTLSQVAQELGRSLEQVRRYLREGKLRGQKLGMQWFIEQRDLEAFKTGGQRTNRREILAGARAVRESIRQREGQLEVEELLDKSRQGSL